MNAAGYILDSGADPGKEALLTAGGVFSHGDIRRGAAAAAAALKKHGIGRGDMVILVDQASMFWVCAYLGTLACGSVSVPLPVTIDPEQFLRILAMTDAKGIFIGCRAMKRYGAVVPPEMVIVTDGATPAGRPVETLATDTLDDRSPVPWTPAEVDDARDMAALIFTSGSTGMPRGVMVSHRNIIANTASIIEYLELTGEDRVMAFLPFYYCFGTSLLHTHLRVGGSLVVENSFLFPNKILKRMAETACTGVAGVPSNFQILLRSSALKKMSFPALRYVQQAGGKLHIVFIEELRDALPGARIYVMYGQTEATARLSCLPPDLLDRKMGSIGRGIPGVKLEVLNEEGRRVAPGEVGEIVAQGENITLGYWQDPEATSAVFRQGRLYTGDLATVDAEGFIYVVDRAKDFIKCGGNRVSCRSIEEVLLRYPGMVELAVIPQYDDSLGEAVCACAVHHEGEGIRDDFIRYCGRNLPWDQIPRTVHFLKDLPRNFSGKIDKPALKKKFSTRPPGEKSS